MCVVRFRSLARATADLCGRKKLPFAGYSIVKERRLEASGCQLAATSQMERPRARRASLQNRRHLPTLPSHPCEAGLLTEADFAVAPASEAGGEYRARTGDLLVANQALSQLS